MATDQELIARAEANMATLHPDTPAGIKDKMASYIFKAKKLAELKVEFEALKKELDPIEFNYQVTRPLWDPANDYGVKAGEISHTIGMVTYPVGEITATPFPEAYGFLDLYGKEHKERCEAIKAKLPDHGEDNVSGLLWLIYTYLDPEDNISLAGGALDLADAVLEGKVDVQGWRLTDLFGDGEG